MKLSRRQEEELARVPGASILCASRRGYGNLLLLVREASGSSVLKLYRRRHAHPREWLGAFSAAVFEGKRGISPRTRYEVEMRAMDLWSGNGFDVFRRIQRPLPDAVAPPAVWLEYCPGRLLFEVLADPDVAWAEKERRIAWLGESLGRRYRRASDLGDTLLIHEHGTTKHVMVWGDRMIFFDLEGAFREGYDLIDAIGHDLSGFVRSVIVPTGERADEALGILARACPQPDLLAQAAERIVHGRGLSLRLRRWQDSRRRGKNSKTDAMRRLLAALAR
jgi:hypothetical protein